MHLVLCLILILPSPVRSEFVEEWAAQEIFTLTSIIHLTLADNLPSVTPEQIKRKVKVLCSAHPSINSGRTEVGKGSRGRQHEPIQAEDKWVRAAFYTNYKIV